MANTVPLVVVWEHKVPEQDHWTPYNSTVTTLLERASRKNLTRVQLGDADPNFVAHYVNLLNMVEVSETYHADVRRVFYPSSSVAGQGVKWEFSRYLEDDLWTPLPMDMQIGIEQAWRNKEPHFEFNHDSVTLPFAINLHNMRGMKRTASLLCNIQRVSQAPYPKHVPEALVPSLVPSERMEGWGSVAIPDHREDQLLQQQDGNPYRQQHGELSEEQVQEEHSLLTTPVDFNSPNEVQDFESFFQLFESVQVKPASPPIGHSQQFPMPSSSRLPTQLPSGPDPRILYLLADPFAGASALGPYIDPFRGPNSSQLAMLRASQVSLANTSPASAPFPFPQRSQSMRVLDVGSSRQGDSFQPFAGQLCSGGGEGGPTYFGQQTAPSHQSEFPGPEMQPPQLKRHEGINTQPCSPQNEFSGPGMELQPYRRHELPNIVQRGAPGAFATPNVPPPPPPPLRNTSSMTRAPLPPTDPSSKANAFGPAPSRHSLAPVLTRSSAGPNGNPQIIASERALLGLAKYVSGLRKVPQLAQPCPMCLQEMHLRRYCTPVVLSRCQHIMHLDCLNDLISNLWQYSGRRTFYIECPICRSLYGEKIGDQPTKGTMTSETVRHSLPGYEGRGTIVIVYSFQSGLQNTEHPSPGHPFFAVGFPRRCYLPDTKQGRLILGYLREAFRRRLLFTIARSTTTGLEDVVQCCVEHKTQQSMYPDPTYMHRCIQQLLHLGVAD